VAELPVPGTVRTAVEPFANRAPALRAHGGRGQESVSSVACGWWAAPQGVAGRTRV